MWFNLVKAGEAGKILPLSQHVEDGFWGAPVFNDYSDYRNNKDKHVFMVAGESMSPGFVHTGDLLFCSLVENDKDLETYKLIVLKVDSSRLKLKNEIDFGFKLRKYIMTIDMNEGLESNLEKLKDVDEEARYSSIEDQELFKSKYQKAFNEINNKGHVLVSVTYTHLGREYSFHDSQDLYAVVDKVLSKTEDGYKPHAQIN